LGKPLSNGNAATPDADEHQIFHAPVPFPDFMGDTGQGPVNILLVKQYLYLSVCHRRAKKKPSRSNGKALICHIKGMNWFAGNVHYLISFYFLYFRQLSVYLSQPFCEVKKKPTKSFLIYYIPCIGVSPALS